MPNSFAYLVLLSYPAFMFWVFRKYSVDRAVIWTLLLAYLLLPPQRTSFDLPVLPEMNKETLPTLFAFVFCIFAARQKVSLLPKSLVAKVLVIIFVFSPIFTIIFNPEPIVFGQLTLPGLSFIDAAALSLRQFIYVIPLLLGRQFLATPEGQRNLMSAIVVCGLLYSIPMLIEVRLSPQINVWVYGYLQHSFEQMVRSGGFRPIVFLYHGLWVAFFAMTAVVSAVVLWREEDASKRVRFLFIAGYLAVVLFLCKSLGSLMFMIILVPLAIFVTRRTQIRIAAIVAILAVSYPLLKGADLVPEKFMLEQAEKINPERSHSLGVRFFNERVLLDRAAEKPIFGWGSWGRNHLHDRITGEITSVTDGRWIITIGTYGWVGFLAEFGLLTFPLLLLWREKRILPTTQVSAYAGTLALIHMVNIVDMIPNATMTPLTWLFAGSIIGYAENLRNARKSKDKSFAVSSTPTAMPAEGRRTVI